MRKLRQAHRVNNFLASMRLLVVMSALALLGIPTAITAGGVRAGKEFQALIQERAELIAEAKVVFDEARERDDHSLTEEETERDDAIQARLDTLNTDIALLERQRNRERDLTAGAPAAEDANTRSPIHTRPNTPSGGPFASLGDQLQTIYAAQVLGNVEAKEKLLSVAAFNDSVMPADFRADALGAGIAIDSDGGFLVQTDISSEIMRKMHDVGDLLGRVKRIPLEAIANGIKLPMIDESSRADGSRLGGIRGYWVEEGEAPTATKPTFAQLELKLHKVAAIGYASEELLAHASAMTAILVDGFAEELRFKVEDAIFEGDGAGKPQGFTAANAVIPIAKEGGQDAATVRHDNLKKMWARAYGRSRANMIWMINQDVEPALDDLAKIIGTAGVEPSYVTYGIDGVQRIKGRPVVVSEYCSTLGTVDDIVLVDPTQYVLIDRGGVQSAQSLHVRFTTDEMAFRATYRVDGGSLWKEAVTPFKGTNTQSPFITLATRA